MNKPEESPPLVTRNTDGSLLSRLAMEEQLRDKLPTVHEKRLLAIHSYGLESKVAYDMKPVTLIHWILDKMIADGEIRGESMEVSSDFGADDHPEYFKQFAQRLALFIENGWATVPMKSEGVDMTKYPTAPITAPPNGQNQSGGFAPPAPPTPGAPQGFAPPAPPTAPPQQQQAYAPPQPPQAYSPPAPPQQPQAAAPPPQPAAYAPPAPPQQQPQAAQAAPQPQTAQGGADPGPPPTKADPNRPWGKASPARTEGQSRPRRNSAEQEEDNAYKEWKEACKAAGLKPKDVEARYAGSAPQQPAQPQAAAQPQQPAAAPQQPSAGAPSPMPPNPLTMMGATAPAPAAAPAQPQAPQQHPAVASLATIAAPPIAAAGQAPSSDVSQVLQNQQVILRKMEMIDVALGQILRNFYQTPPGDPHLETVLAEIGLPVPQ